MWLPRALWKTSDYLECFQSALGPSVFSWWSVFLIWILSQTTTRKYTILNSEDVRDNEQLSKTPKDSQSFVMHPRCDAWALALLYLSKFSQDQNAFSWCYVINRFTLDPLLVYTCSGPTRWYNFQLPLQICISKVAGHASHPLMNIFPVNYSHNTLQLQGMII